MFDTSSGVRMEKESDEEEENEAAGKMMTASSKGPARSKRLVIDSSDED